MANMFNAAEVIDMGIEKEKVNALIEEEKKHLVYLSELKTKYEKARG